MTTLAGQAWVVFYDIDDATQLGAAVRLVEAWTERAVNEAGVFEVRIAAEDLAAEHAEIAHYVRIHFTTSDGDLIRFRGLIEELEYVEPELDGVLLAIRGSSLAAELVYDNTYVGLLADADTPADALTALLASASAWTPTATGTYANAVTQRYSNMSLWEAATKLAEVANGYVRETSTPRELELKNTHADSGLVLSNLVSHGPLLAEDASVIPVLGLPSYRRDGRQLYNRIVPYGRSQLDDSLTLRDATRSSPYTVQSLSKGTPKVTAIAVAKTDGGLSVNTPHEITISCSGQNRLLIVAAFTNEDTLNQNDVVWSRSNAGGRSFIQVEEEQNASLGITSIAYVRNPALGENRIQVASDAGGQIGVLLVAVALENADQSATPFRNWTSGDALNNGVANGSSANPTVSPTSAVGDLIIDFINHDTVAVSHTPDGSQTQIAEYKVEDPAVAVSTKPGGASSTTMAWTLSSSQAYILVALAVKPALTYYIEDSTSVSAYLRRVLTLVNIDLTAYDVDDPEALANALYDYAVDRMLKHKDVVDFVEGFGVPWLPDSVLPGDALRLVFRGVVETATGRRTWLSIDETVIVMRIREMFGQDGVRRWQLGVATALRYAPSDGAVVSEAAIGVSGLKRAEVAA